MIPNDIPNKDTALELPFGELSGDDAFVNTCTNINECLERVKPILDKVLEMKRNYDKLPVNQRIEIDLFLMYTGNTMFWIYLRLKGVDMTNHPIKQEFKRIKSAMLRWKEVKERNLRPTMDIEAAQRFIRSGLYDHNKNRNEQQPQPPNKKIRFEDNEGA